jgi:hypothetical protein
MSRLRIYSESDGTVPLLETSDHARIADVRASLPALAHRKL